MAKGITNGRIAKNVIVSVATQLLSLAVTFVLYLIVPKFIDEVQYSLWQTYILYATNVTLLHFGLIDGIALRYAQYDYDELDKERLRSQFLFIIIFTSAFALITIVTSLIVCSGATRLIVILVGIAIITRNVTLYSSSVLQITNQINKYALLVIMQKIAYGLVVAVLLILHVGNFYWYCIADLIGDLVAIIISPFLNRGIFFGQIIKVRESFKELKTNVFVGFMVMLSNYSFLLLTSGAKMIVQWRWDELMFGKVSFAFSVTSLFLTFVSAISIVLFPSLKRIGDEKLPEMYKSIRGMISPILFLALLFYFPGCWILIKWLPKYSASLPYLGILLPLIIFSSKVSLLTNNYLKVYRKEKFMLIINLVSALVGIGAFALCAYVFDDLNTLLVCVVIIIMLNSVVSEIFVARLINVELFKEFIVEAIMMVGFIVIVKFLDLKYGCLAYAGVFLLYCAVNYKHIISLFKKIFKRKKKQIEAAADASLTEAEEPSLQTSEETSDETIEESDNENG